MSDSIKVGLWSLGSIAVLVAAIVSTTTQQNHPQTTVASQPAQTVIITGKRLTSTELANEHVQTVVISAKRLSLQEKLAYDRAQAPRLATKTGTITNATL